MFFQVSPCKICLGLLLLLLFICFGFLFFEGFGTQFYRVAFYFSVRGNFDTGEVVAQCSSVRTGI